MHEEDNFLENSKPTPDQKFVVKNIVLFLDFRFCADLEDDSASAVYYTGGLRPPVVQMSVHQFTKYPKRITAVVTAERDWPCVAQSSSNHVVSQGGLASGPWISPSLLTSTILPDSQKMLEPSLA